MPIKAEYELICKKCGKNFKIKMGDAIMPKDAIMLKNPLCKLCELKTGICSCSKNIANKH